MRKFLILLFILCPSLVTFAQDSLVTKFLGIPVDGNKAEMIRKIKAKGFTYDPQGDDLVGEFNGEEVDVKVVTNGNKVYRICVIPVETCDESQIKIRYKKLFSDFMNNSKYLILNSDTVENADISFEMTVHEKEFQTAFCQLPKPIEDPQIKEEIASHLKGEYTQEQLSDTLFLKNNYKLLGLHVYDYLTSKYSNNNVWFKISNISFDRYKLVLYYDNNKNQAHGEDL